MPMQDRVPFLDIDSGNPGLNPDGADVFEQNLGSTDERARPPGGYAEGLTYSQFLGIVEDIRWEPPWRRAADKAADYYDGNQLDSDALARMQERGIAPLVYNVTKPVIDVCIGMEAKNRTDFHVAEAGDNQQSWTEVAAALNYKLNLAERKSLADKACADAYAAQLKAGLGWVGVHRETNPYEFPYRVEYVHRREIWWDWHDLSRDLRDSRYLTRSRWVDLDIAKNMFPGDENLLKYVFNGWNGYTDLEDELLNGTDLSMEIDQERVFVLPDFEWRNTARRRIRFFECWYRLWERGYVMRFPNGRCIRYEEKKYPHQIAVAGGQVKLEKATFPTVRLAMWMGPHRMFDVRSPYPHHRFPYVPFWGFREDLTNIPYGLMRSMMHPQDEVNARRSKMLWLLSARRLIADSDAIDQTANKLDDVLDELSRPDAAIFLNPERKNRDADAFRVEENNEVSRQQYELYVDSREMVNKAAGIYQTMLGDAGKGQPKAGIAINSLIEQGITTLAGINDNYQYARMRVGELLLDLVKEDLSAGGAQRIMLGKGAGRYTVELNKPVVNEDNGITEFQNSVQMAEVELELEEVPSTPTQRQQDFMMLTELTKSLPPEVQAAVTDFVIASSNLKDRTKIAERVRTMLNLPEEVPPGQEAAVKQQQAEAAKKQADLAARAAMADIRDKETKAEKTGAEAAQILREIQVGQQAEENPEVQKLRNDLSNLGMKHQEAVMSSRQREIDLSGELERERTAAMQHQHAAKMAQDHASRAVQTHSERTKQVESDHAERAKVNERAAAETAKAKKEAESVIEKREAEMQKAMMAAQEKYERESAKNQAATTSALDKIAQEMGDVIKEIGRLQTAIDKAEQREMASDAKEANDAKPPVMIDVSQPLKELTSELAQVLTKQGQLIEKVAKGQEQSTAEITAALAKPKEITVVRSESGEVTVRTKRKE